MLGTSGRTSAYSASFHSISYLNTILTAGLRSPFLQRPTLLSWFNYYLPSHCITDANVNALSNYRIETHGTNIEERTQAMPVYCSQDNLGTAFSDIYGDLPSDDDFANEHGLAPPAEPRETENSASKQADTSLPYQALGILETTTTDIYGDPVGLDERDLLSDDDFRSEHDFAAECTEQPAGIKSERGSDDDFWSEYDVAAEDIQQTRDLRNKQDSDDQFDSEYDCAAEDVEQPGGLENKIDSDDQFDSEYDCAAEDVQQLGVLENKIDSDDQFDSEYDCAAEDVQQLGVLENRIDSDDQFDSEYDCAAEDIVRESVSPFEPRLDIPIAHERRQSALRTTQSDYLLRRSADPQVNHHQSQQSSPTATFTAYPTLSSPIRHRNSLLTKSESFRHGTRPPVMELCGVGRFLHANSSFADTTVRYVESILNSSRGVGVALENRRNFRMYQIRQRQTPIGKAVLVQFSSVPLLLLLLNCSHPLLQGRKAESPMIRRLYLINGEEKDITMV